MIIYNQQNEIYLNKTNFILTAILTFSTMNNGTESSKKVEEFSKNCAFFNSRKVDSIILITFVTVLTKIGRCL